MLPAAVSELCPAVSKRPSKDDGAAQSIEMLASTASCGRAVSRGTACLLAAEKAAGGVTSCPEAALSYTPWQAVHAHVAALQDAIDRGWFLEAPDHELSTPCLRTILQTAREIAEAMRWLHSMRVVHGDLTGGNVLLDGAEKTSSDLRGFVVKVPCSCQLPGCANWLRRSTAAARPGQGTLRLPHPALLYCRAWPSAPFSCHLEC